MNLSCVNVATYTPEIRVADVDFNVESVKKGILEAEKAGALLVAFPELCLTGYTAGDLFYSKTLLNASKSGLERIVEFTKGRQMIIFVGLPFENDGLIYNVCAVLCDGAVLGIVPKSYLPNYSDFYEKRYFVPADAKVKFVQFAGQNAVPFGRDILFKSSNAQDFVVAVELCEDLWTAVPPSMYHAVNGARIIVNLSSSPEFSGRVDTRRKLIQSHSQRIASAYVYANSGYGESTTDCVFSGHSIVCENGEIIAESKPFVNGLTMAQVDLSGIDYARSMVFNQNFCLQDREYHTVNFSMNCVEQAFVRSYDKTPFIKQGEEEFLIEIAAQGLKKRIMHTNAQKVVIGVSGGLDSTLALIIAVKAMKLVGKSSKDIVSVTMPCFGTSSRTFDNSVKLAKAFDTTLKKIDITKAVKRHLKDICHPEDLHDAAYENAQARERTQVLMDLANSFNGLVVGTGDLSELALGWATYNGDHMSMYAVNASIPKTLVKHLVKYTAENGKGKLKATLLDILDTPVSPELIPSGNDSIKQVTEDIVGPYILHDFFLYMMIKRGFTPHKIYLSAVNSFKGEFDKKTILKWLKTFVRRFFNQQFKRSCLPDGVKVSEISLSPRGSFRMPSDAVSKIWLEELEKIDVEN